MQKCLAFDHAICIHPNKNVTPCCVYMTKQYLQYKDPWQDIFHKQGIQSENGFLDECRDCEWEDKEQGHSHKDNLNEKLAGVEGIAYWDLKFNNTCNLACRMCRPGESRTWTQIVTKEYTDPYYETFENTKWHKDIDLVLSQLHFVKYLKFTGGEPFMIPQVWKVLDKCIELDIAKDIEVYITTNATILKNLETLKHFKRVQINASVDAIGERYEYIRPGAKWEVVKNNILELNKQFIVTVQALPFIFNKDHKHELNTWCKQNNIEVTWAPPLYEPEHMRIDALEKCPDKFYKYAELMDKQHNTNWREWVNA